ncbi:hypothetical protein K4K54_004856 [Colletotrichum sp. SAR 10_86]|nr:hypothetical protein KHU50_009483 [Colletotrichum sp. SAR 10_65]KAI8225081.1 hypothetical protein K4K54_004856 [Colletotrichum sp. SAR 10_86]
MPSLLASHGVWLLLALGLAIASAQDQPPGPVHPGQPSNCNKWHVVKSGDDCESVPKKYSISATVFFGWNPSVSRDCLTNFWIDYAYCVGTGGSSSSPARTTTPKPATTQTTTTKATASISRISSPPGPTFTDTPNNCNSWYLVKSGDNCDTVAARSDITRAKFLEYNPSVSADCTVNFWIGQAYCVGLGPRLPSAPSTTSRSQTQSFNSTYSIRHPITSASLTQPTASEDDVWPPTKTQQGQPSYCSDWHLVQPGEDCSDVVRQHSDFTNMADFFAWNPAVGTDCSGLYLGFYVCVDIQVQTTGVITIPNFAANLTLPPYFNWTEPPRPTVDGNFEPTPSHGPMPTDCVDFAEARTPLLTRDKFFEWNPVLAGNCDGLWAGNYYCVAASSKDEPPPQPPTVSKKPEDVAVDTTDRCVRWYLAVPGDLCSNIALMFGSFSDSDFRTWNPSVGSECTTTQVSAPV